MQKCKLSIKHLQIPLTNKKQSLRKVWVNIYDLLDAVKRNECPPHRFESRIALANYTIQTNRVYPKKKAKKEGPVRELLAHIFA
jgi:hypothetical protein